MFRVALVENLEEMEKTGLITLLDSLVAKMVLFDERWFKNQKAINEFLAGILQMVD